MPQYDANGKRLSGAALVRHQVNRKLRESGALAMPEALPNSGGKAHFEQLRPPPLRQGVDACEAWANSLALLCASCAVKQIDPIRNRLLRKVVAKLGRMKARARVSALACESRWMRDPETSDEATGWIDALVADEPNIADPIAGAAWAFMRLCTTGYEISQADSIDEARWIPIIDSLSNVVMVECQRLQRLVPRPAKPGRKR